MIHLSTIACLLLISCYQPSAEELQVESNTPRFATSTVRPWGFVDRQGQERGLLVEFARRLSLASGVNYTNFLQPYPRVIHSLGTGYVDFAVLFEGPLADQTAIHVGHVADTEVLVVARAGAQPLSSIEQLKGMTIGHIRGSKYGDDFDNATHFTRMPINTMQQGLAMVLTGRLDAMASAEYTLYHAMEEMGLAAGQISRLIAIRKASVGLYISRHSNAQELIPVYRKALQQMKNEGQLARIFHTPQLWSAESH